MKRKSGSARILAIPLALLAALPATGTGDVRPREAPPIASAPRAAPHTFLTYRVVPGDQLGRILQALNLSPIWGPKGYLRKTLDLNPRLKSRGGNSIRHRMVIRLPVRELPAASHYEIDERGRVSLLWYPDEEAAARGVASTQRPAPSVDRQPAAETVPMTTQAIQPEETPFTSMPLSATSPAVETAPLPVLAPEPVTTRVISVAPSLEALPPPAPGPAGDDRFFLSISPGGTFVRIDSMDKANGTHAILSSYLGPGLRIAADYQFYENWSYGVSYRLQQLQFLKPKTRTLDQDGTLLNDVGMTIGYRGWRIPLSLNLAFAERYFPAFSSPTTLALDRTLVPRAQLSGRLKVAETRNLNLGLSGGGGLLFPTSTENYAVFMGYNVFVRADSRFKIGKSWTMTTGFRLDQSSQNSSQVTYQALGVVIDFGFEWWVNAEEGGNRTK